MAIDSRLIQVRRGKDAEIETEKQKLASGEPAVTTDTQRLFWGFGSGQAKEVAFKGEVEDIISNFESTIDDKIDEAVSEVTKEMEDALVAIENKKEEALEGIPEDYTALDAEVKALRKELDVSAPGIIQTASGTEIIVTDSADKPFVDFALDGKGEQMSTDGYQLFDASKLPTASMGGATVTNNGDGSFTVSGSGNLTEGFNFNYIIQNEDVKKLFKPGELRWGKSKVYPYFDVTFIKADGNTLGITSFSSTESITLPEDLFDDSTFARIYIYGGSGKQIVPGTIKPMLYQDGDGTWEPFTGGNPSPSPEYPQEIVNAGRMWNLFGGEVLADKLVEIVGATKNENTKRVSFESSSANDTTPIYGGYFKEKTPYTFIVYGQTNDSNKHANLKFKYTDGTSTTLFFDAQSVDGYKVWSSDGTKTLLGIYTQYAAGITILYYEECGIFEGVKTLDDYRPYTGMYETEVVVRGKNWLKNTAESQTINGVTFTVNEDKSVTVNGTANNEAPLTTSVATLKSGTYTLSGCPKGGSNSTYRLAVITEDEQNFITRDFGSDSIFTLTEDTKVKYRVSVLTTVSNLTFYPMIRLASDTDNTYEPYKEPQTAIITTSEPLRASKDGAYKDRVYLDGTVERQIKEVVFDGSDDENLVKNTDNGNSYLYYTPMYTDEMAIGKTCLCNLLMEKPIAEGNSLDNLLINTTNEFDVIYFNLGYYMTENTVAELRRVLSENPITVQYVLATPTTEELNAESKQALQALRTNYHNTVVTNDQGAEMELRYVADTKLYIDNLIAGVSAAVLS